MTVEALRSRQTNALEHLLAVYGRELQSVAWLILRDRADAEDVVIETLLTAWDKAGTIRDEAALRVWLLRVATNHALGLRRSSARVVRLHVVPERLEPDGSHASADRIALLAGIAELPAQMRAAVVLHYYADLPVHEVAAALGKSPNTVKSQLQTALDRLRHALADGTEATAGEVRHA